MSVYLIDGMCVYIHVHRYACPHDYVCICIGRIEYVCTFMCIGVHTHANAKTGVLICVCVCVCEYECVSA